MKKIWEKTYEFQILILNKIKKEGEEKKAKINKMEIEFKFSTTVYKTK